MWILQTKHYQKFIKILIENNHVFLYFLLELIQVHNFNKWQKKKDCKDLKKSLQEKDNRWKQEMLWQKDDDANKFYRWAFDKMNYKSDKILMNCIQKMFRSVNISLDKAFLIWKIELIRIKEKLSEM